MTLHILRCPLLVAPRKRPIAPIRRRPKRIPIIQNSRCNAPMKTIESVDCEKIHATGAKPINKIELRQTAAKSAPTNTAQLRVDPAETSENVKTWQANQH